MATFITKERHRFHQQHTQLSLSGESDPIFIVCYQVGCCCYKRDTCDILSAICFCSDHNWVKLLWNVILTAQVIVTDSGYIVFILISKPFAWLHMLNVTNVTVNCHVCNAIEIT